MLKLVRLDQESSITPSFSIELIQGVHYFGRGVLLECEDKRVSRRHGSLNVNEQTVELTALHTNPCFVIKKGEASTQVLKSGSSISLCLGDKIGLLPNSHWYQLVECDSGPVSEPTKDNGAAHHDIDEEIMNVDFDEEFGEQNASLSPSILNANTSTSPNLSRKRLNGDTIDTENDITNKQLRTDDTQVESSDDQSIAKDKHKSENKQTTEDRGDNQTSVEDRIESETNNESRTEGENESRNIASSTEHASNNVMDAEEVKPNVDQLNAAMAATASTSSCGDNVQVKSEAESPPPPPPAPQVRRERCMYGRQCYRRNPQHKAAYSHPEDGDWGAGAQGECPWGDGCTRTDPRHWRDHSHPTLRAPPHLLNPRGPPRMVYRHGNIFYINAHSVHFHDDHFQVQDSDGESVDYDYEF